MLVWVVCRPSHRLLLVRLRGERTRDVCGHSQGGGIASVAPRQNVEHVFDACQSPAGKLARYWRLACHKLSPPRPSNVRYEMRSAAVVGLLALAILGGCDKPQPAAEIRPVRTVTAVAGSDGEPVSLTGHIRAQKEQSLAFRIDGRIIKRHVEVGQVVRPNDLIAELDPVPQRDAL